MKEQELKYYKQFAEFLQKYEEANEKRRQQFSDVKLVSGDSKSHLKNKLDELSVSLTNPFKHIRNWIKGEVMNLESLMSAISEKEACVIRKQKAIKSLQDKRELIAKINQGKFSIKTMLKSKDQKNQK